MGEGNAGLIREPRGVGQVPRMGLVCLLSKGPKGQECDDGMASNRTPVRSRPRRDVVPRYPRPLVWLSLQWVGVILLHLVFPFSCFTVLCWRSMVCEVERGECDEEVIYP